MVRILSISCVLLLAGCGDAAKSPVAEEKSPQPPAPQEPEKTVPPQAAADDGKTNAPRAAAEPAPESDRTSAEAKTAAKPVASEPEPAAKPAEPEPAAKPAEPPPRPKIFALDPADVAPPGSAPPAKPAARGGELVLRNIRLTVPDTWVAKPAGGTYLLAEYALPRAAGDEADGRVTVAAAGGSVKEVVAMWRDLFGGKPEKESQEELQILGLWASLVDMSGTYRTQASQSAPVESHPNYRMLAVMCDVGDPSQMYFIKAVGPAKTIAAREKEFRAFVNSIKLRQAP